MKATLAAGAGKALPGAAGDMLSMGDNGLCPGMSIKDRFKFFVICMAVGVGFLVLGIMTMLVAPTLFAFYFTISNIAFIAGSMFLMGPKKQLHMLNPKKNPKRFQSFAGFILSVCLTVFFIFSGHANFIVILVAAGCQFASYWFYMLSYIPYGQAGAKKLAEQAFKS